MSTWDAGLYLRFGDERTRPAVDLVSRIQLSDPGTIVDLGCGPGNSTQVLRRRWPSALVSGLDSSPDMIAAARRDHPDQQWVLGSIEDWPGQHPVDLVFSNAALQWVHNHARLLPALFDRVARGGALAFQVPSRAYSPLRAFISEIAGHMDWAARMSEANRALTMEEPSLYYDALVSRARALEMWETEYIHVMPGPEAIVEWISSTGLRPYLDALDTADEKQRFVAALTARVAAAYPRRSDGRVLFPFRRLFVIAYA